MGNIPNSTTEKAEMA